MLVRSTLVLIVCSSVVVLRAYAQAGAAPDYRAQAIQILRTVPLIDGHNDIPDAIRDRGGVDSVDFSATQLGLMTDIPKLREGHVGAQFWAAYVPVTTMHEGEHPAVYALEQIDLVHRLCARYPRDLAMALTAADVERNFKAGKISCLIGIEGGHAIESSLGALRMFYALGTRYMTLTHWETTDWADAATDSAKHGGLTAFGEQVVLEMNRLGMLVDLSHVSDGTMMDALRVSKAPVMFSHSSARSISNHVRNVPDSILRLVTANGGIVMVNFNPGFVSETVRLYEDSIATRTKTLRAAGVDTVALADSAKRWDKNAPRATLQQVADHIEHVRDVAGIDHVGLGSDFDGITSVPAGLENVSKFPDLVAELLKRGWKVEDVKKIVGLNALRVLREAQRVSQQMKH
ncbi:MAG TPA: dipeptidase [Gemmatimonadales bacterium]|nr:dipeptidase [Gemmatimonadales bacterium]